jgi:hypothetical protein
MIRFIAVAFALTVATSAQAMSPAPLHQAVRSSTRACPAVMRIVPINKKVSREEDDVVAHVRF